MKTKWILLALFALTAYVADAQKTYRVGDYYNENGKEGIVFWVDETGEHGKIVGMKEAADLWWDSDPKLFGTNNEFDGMKNHDRIKKQKGLQDKNPALAWCTNLGEGWYLPAIEELKIFTLNNEIHDAVNRGLLQYGGKILANKGDKCWYWSSTECNSKTIDRDGLKLKSSCKFYAWGVRMYHDHDAGIKEGVDIFVKFDSHTVRAVAKF